MSSDVVRVLHVVSDPVVDRVGETDQLLSLILGQLSAGLKVTVVATLSGQEHGESLMRLGTSGARVVLLVPCTPPMLTHPNLHEVVDQAVSESDVVHIHACWQEVQHAAAAAARRHGVPYVITPRGLLTRAALAVGWLKKRFYLLLRLKRHLHAASMVHFSDEQERNETLAAVNVSAPALVEEVPLDLSVYRELPPLGTFRARFPLLKDRPMLFYHGPLTPESGLERLIHALAVLSDRRAALVIAGADSQGYQDRLVALGRHLDVADRLLLSPALNPGEVVAGLSDADVLILPGPAAEAHRRIIQGLAAGTMVVAPQDFATARLAADYPALRLFEPTNVKDLAQAIHSAIEQSRDLGHNLQASRRQVLEKYDPVNIARRWEKHYRQLCQRRVMFGPAVKKLHDQTLQA